MKQYFQLIDGRIIITNNLEILPEDLEKQYKYYWIEGDNNKNLNSLVGLINWLRASLGGEYEFINITKLEI